MLGGMLHLQDIRDIAAYINVAHKREDVSNGVKQRRLAGAVGPDQGRDAVRDLQMIDAHRFPPPTAHSNVVDSDRRRAAFRSVHTRIW